VSPARPANSAQGRIFSYHSLGINQGCPPMIGCPERSCCSSSYCFSLLTASWIQVNIFEALLPFKNDRYTRPDEVDAA